MFDKLKQLKNLKDIQKNIKSQKIDLEHRGVRVTMTGEFKVEDIKLNPDLDIKSQEVAVREALNLAKDKIQASLADMFSGGF